MRIESSLASGGPESVDSRVDRDEAHPATAFDLPEDARQDRRRRVLIDRRLQLRAGVLVTTTALVLVILLNLALLSARTRTADALLADTPELAEVLRSRNRIELGLMLFASTVFLAAVFTITVLETHKTAGAAYNLNRQMARVGKGRFRTHLTLRQDDNLRAVENGFNEMTRTLLDHACREVEDLDQVADEARLVSSPVEARELAERIQELAERKRRELA